MTSWANRGKAATQAIPVSKPATERGERHVGMLDSATTKVYKTGSFGVEFKYVIDGLERAVYENVVLFMQDVDGNPTPTKYGEATLKRRLQAFGLTAEEINGFKIPKTVKDEAAATAIASLAGIGVAVYLANSEYMGKPKKDVKSVWPLEG